MNIYFAWVKGSEVYDSTLHAREDEKIFHLEISQKEAGYARARVVLQNPYHGLLWPKDKQHCLISCDEGPLFKGRLLAMPCQIKGELITIDFIAIPGDFEEKRHTLCQEIMSAGVYDPLYFSEEKPSLRDLLQAYTALPYWDRLSGKLSLSDIFRGKKRLDVSGNFFRDSLTVQMLQNPLREVNVDISAQWIQQAKGCIEVGQHIKKACPQGYLSTLNGPSLEQSWWPDKQALRLNGYRLETSQLTRLNPENERKFPSASKAYWHKADKPKQVRFPRTWYDVQMRFGWSYNQKRRETAVLNLKQKIQDLSVGVGQRKSLSFNLNTILGQNHPWCPNRVYTRDFCVLYNGMVYRCIKRHTSKHAFDPKKWKLLPNLVHVDGQSARAEFFPTTRGQQAIGYGMEVAKAHLASSARCIQLTFRAPWQGLTSLTLDHNVVLQDERLPGATVTGKVVAYRFIADGASGEKIVEVKLGVSAGDGITSTDAFPEDSFYVEDGYAEENPSAHAHIYARSSSTLCYRIGENNDPPMGIHRPAELSEYDLIQQIEIMDDAVFQEHVLEQQQFPHSDDLKKVLRQRPTNVRIKLKDLRTHGCLDRTVHVETLTVWSAPKHIDLAAPCNREAPNDL